MIKVEDAKIFNIEGAITGMRFPMQSWEKSDSEHEFFGYLQQNGQLYSSEETKFIVGPNDLALAQKLIASGADSHSKFLRQIFVSMNITAPLYWWKEMDTYKVGTTSNSESTMHRLAKTPITKECFSFDNDIKEPDEWFNISSNLVRDCERLRQHYLETQDKHYWRALIQLLPNSWNQMRHWTANFQVLRKIYIDRRFHKLQEWRDFCAEIEKLPYGKELITFGVNKNDTAT
jgi:hypothetical protein